MSQICSECLSPEEEEEEQEEQDLPQVQEAS